MNGTEKQIKWAEDIINNAYNTIDANIANMENKNEEFFTTRVLAYRECRKQLDEVLNNCNDAATIIKNRDLFDPTRINRMVCEMVVEMKRSN